MAHMVEFAKLKPQRTFLHLFAKYRTHENYRLYDSLIMPGSEWESMAMLDIRIGGVASGPVTVTSPSLRKSSRCSVTPVDLIHEPMVKEAMREDNGIHFNEAHEVEFDRLIAKLAITRKKIADSISQCIHPASFDDLKTLLILCFLQQEELENATDVKSVINVMMIRCTIINIVPMETIVDYFNLKETKRLVEQYNVRLDVFCNNLKLKDVLNKDLFPHHQPSVQNEIKFILDWNPDHHKFQDIRRLLEKAFKDIAKRVIVKRMSEGSSIIVLCSAPNHLLDALYLEAQNNVTVLIEEFSLIQLKIGSYTVYDKILRGKEMKIMTQQLEREVKELQALKNVNIQKIADENKTLLKERSVPDTFRLAPMQEVDQNGEMELVGNTSGSITQEDAFTEKILIAHIEVICTNFKRQLEEHLQKKFKHHVEKFEKHCEAMASEMTRLSEENKKLKQEMKGLREEYDQKFKDLAERFQTPSSEGPVTETAENEEVPVASATGSVVEPPLPVISDLLLKLDDLASQIIPKEATNKRRSMLESHTNEVRTAYKLPPKIDTDKFDSQQLPLMYSASSSGIGSSTGSLKISSEDNSTTAAAEKLLPPVVKSHPILSTPAIRRGQSMTEKDHNYLEVIWTMSDFTDALMRLLEQEKH